MFVAIVALRPHIDRKLGRGAYGVGGTLGVLCCRVDQLACLPEPWERGFVVVKVLQTPRPVGLAVALDTALEDFGLGVQDVVVHSDSGVGETVRDFPPVRLHEDGLGDDERPADVAQHLMCGLGDERPPRRPVLEVSQCGKSAYSTQQEADLLGVEDPGFRESLNEVPRDSRLPDTECAVQPNDHESSVMSCPCPPGASSDLLMTGVRPSCGCAQDGGHPAGGVITAVIS